MQVYLAKSQHEHSERNFLKNNGSFHAGVVLVNTSPLFLLSSRLFPPTCISRMEKMLDVHIWGAKNYQHVIAPS